MGEGGKLNQMAKEPASKRAKSAIEVDNPNSVSPERLAVIRKSRGERARIIERKLGGKKK